MPASFDQGSGEQENTKSKSCCIISIVISIIVAVVLIAVVVVLVVILTKDDVQTLTLSTGSTCKVTDSGTYDVSGSTDNSIVVSSSGDVTLKLDDVSVTTTGTPAIEHISLLRRIGIQTKPVYRQQDHYLFLDQAH